MSREFFLAVLLLVTAAIPALAHGPEQAAPADTVSEAASHAAHPHEEEAPPSELPTFSRLARFAGRFHPIAVHFPIALLLSAFVSQLIGVQFGKPRFEEAAQIMLLFGAPAAIAAAALGWSAAAYSSHTGDSAGVLTLHRWFGTATAPAPLLALAIRAPRRRLVTLAVIAILVGITGYFGGVLVHGREHFQW